MQLLTSESSLFFLRVFRVLCGDNSRGIVSQAALRQAQGDNLSLQSSPVSFVVSPPRSSSGFTLLEILIVTIIIALVASIGIPRFIGSIERAQVKSTAGEIANIMRLARLKALSEKRIVTVEVDTEKRVVRALYSGDGNEMAAEPIKIPDSIRLLTGSPSGFYNRPMSFEFNPTGGATGGDLYISLASAKVMDGKGYIVRLKPLSGNSIVIRADDL